VLTVEQPFAVPLIDQETGEVLDRELVGTWDLLERDAEVSFLKIRRRRFICVLLTDPLFGRPCSHGSASSLGRCEVRFAPGSRTSRCGSKSRCERRAGHGHGSRGWTGFSGLCCRGCGRAGGIRSILTVVAHGGSKTGV
jgi:hypothetical protein